MRAGGWETILPQATAAAFLPDPDLVSIPVTDPQVAHLMGLVIDRRDPRTPLLDALVTLAERRAGTLD